MSVQYLDSQLAQAPHDHKSAWNEMHSRIEPVLRELTPITMHDELRTGISRFLRGRD